MLDQSALNNISSKGFQNVWLKDRFTNTGKVTSKVKITKLNKHQEVRIYEVSLEEEIQHNILLATPAFGSNCILGNIISKL